MKNQHLHDFLRQQFFPDNTGYYEYKSVGDFVLVHQINGKTKETVIAVYTKEKWEKSRRYLEERLGFTNPIDDLQMAMELDSA